MSKKAAETSKLPESKRENSISQIKNIGFSRAINSSVDHAMFLQRTIGNQAVQRLLKSNINQEFIKQKKIAPKKRLMNLNSRTAALRLTGHSRGRTINSHVRSREESQNSNAQNNVFIHDDHAAHVAATTIGAHAFTHGHHIYLGPTIDTPFGPTKDTTLRHELIHIAQLRFGQNTGRVSSPALVEQEAQQLTDHTASIVDISHGASSEEIYGLFWVLIPLAAAAYVMLRPNVANAPAPGERTYPSVSELQVAGEAFALFAVPGGAYGLGSRLGWGFYASSAFAGASTTVSFRGVQDIGRGEFSGVGAYVIDAATGAVIGVIVPGGIRLVGRAGTRSFDWLATQGMKRSDMAISRMLSERAATAPIPDEELAALLQPKGWTGRASNWWLNRQGLTILYRGQGAPSQQILSPLAREEGVAASEALVARMRAAGMSNKDIARMTAIFHKQPVPASFGAPHALAGRPLGAVGIPTTRIPGVAAEFAGGARGVVYVIRIPRGAAVRVPKWGLSAENEYVILNRLPEGSVVGTIPVSRMPALTVDEAGCLILAR